MNIAGLPALHDLPDPDRGRYNPIAIERLVVRTARWWRRELHREWQQYLDQVVQDPNTGHTLEWEETHNLAMRITLYLGGYSGRREVEFSKRQRRRVSTPRLQKLQFRQATASLRMTKVDWSRRPVETYDEYKERVFGPLKEETWGVGAGFVEQYVERRLPPLRHASVVVQRRTRDVIAWVQQQDFEIDDRQYRDTLQAATQFQAARVENIIRTETSTLYNAGRYMSQASDEEVVGWEYDVTLDERTTEICEQLHGKKVMKPGASQPREESYAG